MGFGGFGKKMKGMFRFKRRAGKKGVQRTEGVAGAVANAASKPTDMGARADAASAMVRP